MTIARGLTVLLATGLAFAACGSEDADPGSSKDGGADAAPDVANEAANDATGDAADAGEEAAAEAAAPKVLLPKSGLSAAELGVLVNDSDPQSKEVADYYVAARKVPAANVVSWLSR